MGAPGPGRLESALGQLWATANIVDFGRCAKEFGRFFRTSHGSFDRKLFYISYLQLIPDDVILACYSCSNMILTMEGRTYCGRGEFLLTEK